MILVSSRKFRDSWVFPVGGIDEGETPEEAAARECLEESGFRVEMEKNPIHEILFEGAKRDVEYTFFEAKALEDTGDYEMDRERMWCPLPDLPDTVAGIFREVAEIFVTKR